MAFDDPQDREWIYRGDLWVELAGAKRVRGIASREREGGEGQASLLFKRCISRSNTEVTPVRARTKSSIVDRRKKSIQAVTTAEWLPPRFLKIDVQLFVFGGVQ